jgi:flagellar hook-associated protein 1
MSLTTAFSIARNGLGAIEQRISVTANNISNADKPGYTRQTYAPEYATLNDATVTVGGSVEGTVDQYLTKQVVDQRSDYGYKSTITAYLDNYDKALGSTDSKATLSGSLDTLSASLSSLSNDSSSGPAKNSVVENAKTLSSQLNGLSVTIQDSRNQTNRDIKTSVTAINNTVDRIATINKQLTAANTGTNTAVLIDERNEALKSLAGEIGIVYYADSNNQITVYTESGEQLVNGITSSHLEYTPSTSVSSSTVYPGGFGAITIKGKDITTSTTSGRLGSLVELRDRILPNEQAKIDSFANSLKDVVNTALNKGASIPARIVVTGAKIFLGSDAFSATGNIRIALIDKIGNLQSYADIDISGAATVDDVVATLNGSGLNITASLDSKGQLKIESNSVNSAISINELNSSAGIGSKGFSNYFGLNDMFVSSFGASDIRVSDTLKNSSEYLATATLSSSAALTVGERVVNSGDSSTVKNLANALKSSTTFAAAGGLAVQSNTLSSYINLIMGNAATQYSNAKTVSENSAAVLDSLNTTVSSNSGVNINEETANSATLQNAYSATAQIMSTVSSMFKELLNAIG